METEYDDFGIANRAGDRSAQIIQVESGKYAAVVAVCGAICGLALAVALWAGYQAQLMTTENRVAINHSMEMEARLTIMEQELHRGNR